MFSRFVLVPLCDLQLYLGQRNVSDNWLYDNSQQRPRLNNNNNNNNNKVLLLLMEVVP